MRVSALAVAAALTACAVPRSVTLQNVASANIAPDERPAVWGRALHAFQARGLLISVSDREGGVLASYGQPSTVPCRSQPYGCDSFALVQLTICDDGEAAVRVNRRISGITLGGDLLAPDERASLERESREMLAAILGKAVESVRSATPQRSTSPRRGVGASCSEISECEDGLTCSLMTCRR
jgi:hypothetical protein